MLWVRSQSKFAVGLSDQMQNPFASAVAPHPHGPWEEQRAGGFSQGVAAARHDLALLQGCRVMGRKIRVCAQNSSCSPQMIKTMDAGV